MIDASASIPSVPPITGASPAPAVSRLPTASVLALVARLEAAVSRRLSRLPVRLLRSLDCLFLALLVFLPALAYLGDLGFYGDDWDILSLLRLHQDQSLSGLFAAFYQPHDAAMPRPVDHAGMRPAQILYYIVLYLLFDFEPLGYHVVNTLMIAGMPVLGYLVLRQLGVSRQAALACAAVYGLLPHYSTDRFWMAANMAALSMALYLASLLLDLGALRAFRQGRHIWGYKAGAAVLLVASTLAYEVALPLFLLAPLVLWWRTGRACGPWGSTLLRRLREPGYAALLMANVVTLAAVAGFKVATTTRLESGASLRGQIGWFGERIAEATTVNFGDFGLRLPWTVWRLATSTGGVPGAIAIWVSIVVGFVVAFYLLVAGQERTTDPRGKRRYAGVVVAGAVVYGLGYAIFLTNKNMGVDPTGISNRTAIASAAGMALVIAGSISYLGALWRSAGWQRTVVAVLAGLLCGCYWLVNATIGTHWVEANYAQRTILGAMREDVPDLPPGATVLLDGTCPYAGPAIVFESHWDLAGALSVYYRDPALRAGVVTPRMRVGDDGVRTRLYGQVVRFSYNRLLIYHAGKREVFPIPDAAAARAYLQDMGRDLECRCPAGREGHGVKIL